MADTNVLALQQTVNRYATVAAFSVLQTDGVVGPLTQSAVQRSLKYIAGQMPYARNPAVSNEVAQQAAYLNQAMVTQQQVAANAATLSSFLATTATTIGLAPGAGGSQGNPVVDWLKSLFSTTDNPRPTVPTIPNAPPPPNPVPSNTSLAPRAAGFTTSVAQAWQTMPTWGKVGAGMAVGLGLVFGVSAIRKRKSLPAG